MAGCDTLQSYAEAPVRGETLILLLSTGLTWPQDIPGTMSAL